MYKREGSEFAEEQHGIVVRASWSVVSSMEQCRIVVSGQFDGAVRWRKGRSPGRDRDLATSDDAIPGAHERVMRQRVKLIVRSSCGVTERSASSAARHTSNQEPNINKTKRERERESRRILVCQESKKQVSRS